MSKNEFKKGIEAAAKANIDFMNKQAEATAEVGKRVIQKIDELGHIVEIILDDLNSQEKKELYNLQSAHDIAAMDKNEREVLASTLFTLISKYEQNNDNQKEYYFAVKNHLGVTDVSPDFDLSLIENVDSRNDAKAMYQTVCEFLFLNNADTYFLEEFEEELSYFGISRKASKEILDSILKVYDILGLRGIVEHYIPAENDEVLPDHYGLLSPVKSEQIIEKNNNTFAEGTETEFENVKVIIKSQMFIDGKVTFKNCIIEFEVNENFAVALRKTGEAQFLDCEFVSTTVAKFWVISLIGKCTMKDCLFNSLNYVYGNENQCNRAFIGLNSDSRKHETALLTIDHCHITGCEGSFISGDGNANYDNFKLVMINSKVDNHTGNFLMGRFADRGNDTGFFLQNCKFENVAIYKKEKEHYEREREHKSRRFELDHDYFDYVNSNYLSFIYTNEAGIICEDCTFASIEESTIYSPCGYWSGKTFIKNCSFVKCNFDEANDRFPVKSSTGQLSGVITNCSFIEIGGVGSPGYKNCLFCFAGGGSWQNNAKVSVSNCTFSNIQGKIKISYGSIEHCTFQDSKINITIEGETGSNNVLSEANDLVFNNCTAIVNEDILNPQVCFLSAKKSAQSDKDQECVSFNGCKFNDCKTQGKYITITEDCIYGIFDRRKTFKPGRESGTVIK